MNLAAFADDFLQINVGTAACSQTSIEGGRGFSARFPYLVGFKRAFDHIGYRAVLPASKAMSQIACFCTAH